MKKSTLIIKGAILTIACVSLSSCATLLSGNRAEVVLVNPPKDLKVYEDGKELPIEQVYASTKTKGLAGYAGSTTTNYFAAGVKVSKKIKNHTLTLESEGKKVDVTKRTKVKGGIVFLDIIFTGFIGLPIDGATKKWRAIKSNHLDVPAIISGAEQKSQSQLKKIIRLQAGANK